jgi:hypothetical protein
LDALNSSDKKDPKRNGKESGHVQRPAQPTNASLNNNARVAPAEIDEVKAPVARVIQSSSNNLYS